MNFDLCHIGNNRQHVSVAEAEQAAKDEVPVGISPDLKVPRVTHPAEESEQQLHGDVEGSPYSPTPGTLSLEEAAAKAGDPKAAEAPASSTSTRRTSSSS